MVETSGLQKFVSEASRARGPASRPAVTKQQGMAKRSAAAAAPEFRSRRGARAHAVRLLQRIHHRFLRLLGAATPKTGRRTAKSARKVARPREPKSLRAADEKQEQDVEARSPDAAATDASASASEAAVAGKYWAHRYSLFNLYDRGVRMDAEGWYSATPESIAASQASRAAPGDLVVDAFAGCGGNSIQFAARYVTGGLRGAPSHLPFLFALSPATDTDSASASRRASCCRGCYVVAVEIDPRKVELAAHNARVYGVEDRIEFIVGDFFRLAPLLKVLSNKFSSAAVQGD